MSRMSRMFIVDGKPMRTWNVFVGCRFDCTYCNAKKAAETRLKHIPRYKDGFNPHIVESELNRTFKPGEFIFVAYMGDIAFATHFELCRIISKIASFPDTRFLLCTKNPGYLSRWSPALLSNIYQGTTLETNRPNPFSKAPPPNQRALDLRSSHHWHTFLSIEPIMDFDLDYFSDLIAKLRPDIIEVGADNYHNHLPEPPPEKLEKLLANLRDICPNVIEKVGLDRLKVRKVI